MSRFDIDSYFDTMKACTELLIREEWEESVKVHIANAKKMVEICESADLDENSIDLSNTFNPGAR